jgi:hypothetical protein
MQVSICSAQRKPEAIASGLISDHDALDLAPGLTGFVAPAM